MCIDALSPAWGGSGTGTAREREPTPTREGRRNQALSSSSLAQHSSNKMEAESLSGSSTPSISGPSTGCGFRLGSVGNVVHPHMQKALQGMRATTSRPSTISSPG